MKNNDVNRIVNPELTYNAIVNDIVSYLKNYQIKSVNLGISGGIDSTVVACILHDVSNTMKNDVEYPFSFYGYSLPTCTTENDEYFTSLLVGEAFCDNFEKYSIDKIATIVSDEWAKEYGYEYEYSDMPKIAFRRGNIKSRLRTIYLYDKAKKNNGIVVGTDNLTEKLLGFSTIGGDALADYMPIQYLWKTEVYVLAEYLKERYIKLEQWDKVNALDKSIKLIPQDGLGISNSDMEQIGAKDYFDVDEILATYVEVNGYANENKLTPAIESNIFSDYYKILVKKFSKDVVDKVIDRYKCNFKLNLPVTPTLKF